jgi:hypothetical protein
MAKKTGRGRKQDRARVAGGQGYEVRYEAKKTAKSKAKVKRAVKRAPKPQKGGTLPRRVTQEGPEQFEGCRGALAPVPSRGTVRRRRRVKYAPAVWVPKRKGPGNHPGPPASFGAKGECFPKQDALR